jgi:hypothetical protein
LLIGSSILGEPIFCILQLLKINEMGLIISSSEDFNFGRYMINDDDWTRQSLKQYIKLNEKKLLYDLLGIELADLLLLDLDQYKEPQNARFTAIFNPLSFNFKDKIYHSEGIKEVLKGLVYAEFTKEQNFKNNINGNSQNLYEQGEVISSKMAGLTNKYSEAIDSFWSIQVFCCDNRDVYPEFNGQSKDYNSIF